MRLGSPQKELFLGIRVIQFRRQRLVLVELLSSLCYQRRGANFRDELRLSAPRWVRLRAYRRPAALGGLVYPELKGPELIVVDGDDISANTANSADLLLLAAPTTLPNDVTRDIALLTSHRGLSRARKVKAQRLQSAVARTESRRNTGRPVESVSHFTARDLLHRFCIQRI